MARKNTKELPPLFFCDNCGAEVSQDEPSCPKCGRRFASIRCPKCGFSGEEKLFADGCPECGYAVLSVGKTVIQGKKGLSHGTKKEDGRLAQWAVFLAFAFFLCVFAFLLFYISR